MHEPKPDSPSADYLAMAPYWRLVSDLLDGTEAMRAAGEKYLPRFAEESRANYEYRRKTAKYTGVYRDIVENLAAKPFKKEVGLVETSATPEMRAIAENVDGRGNSLHVFAQDLFFHGINDALSWVLVDFPKAGGKGTIADEKRRGARPYWVHVKARNVLAVETDMINGVEQFVHVRIRENSVVRDGYAEKTVERIRVIDRARLENGDYAVPTWEVFEKQEKTGGRSEWLSIDAGTLSIGIIPLVPFLAGRRKGGSWEMIPPLQDCAHTQIEHYQAESALKQIKDLCCFPMLSGSGVEPDRGDNGGVKALGIGPRAVLYAPPDGSGNHGEWKFIEPAATSMNFLAKDIERIEQQLRELGRQPLTAQSGNLTVISTAFAASKANSVISAWALNLKDALENAFVYTAMWIGAQAVTEVEIETDFDVSLTGDEGTETLISMREKGDISQRTLWSEMKRRGVLSPEFNADREIDRLIDELPDDSEDDRLGAVVPFRTGTE